MAAPPDNHSAMRPSGRRITLTQLLSAIAVSALLFAYVLRPGDQWGERSPRYQCLMNLKQIALALHNYEQAYHGLPPAYTVDARGKPLRSWRTLILPYIEQEPLYRTIDLSLPWNHPANAAALNTVITIYHCPRATGPPNTTTYLALMGPNASFLPNQPRRMAEITDDQARTLMVFEAGDTQAVPWMAPVDVDASLLLNLGSAAKLHHLGGTNASFVDGYVGFLNPDTPSRVLRAWLSIAGDDDEITKTW